MQFLLFFYYLILAVTKLITLMFILWPFWIRFFLTFFFLPYFFIYVKDNLFLRWCQKKSVCPSLCTILSIRDSSMHFYWIWLDTSSRGNPICYNPQVTRIIYEVSTSSKSLNDLNSIMFLYLLILTELSLIMSWSVFVYRMTVKTVIPS